MDIFAHAVCSATVCSRTGLAGGRRGPSVERWYKDATIWWSVLFGLAPDILSMWIPLAIHVLSGNEGNFFYLFGGRWLVVYRVTHSLLMAVAISWILFMLRHSLFVPSLAWMVHVLVDAVSHGSGKFQTILFYPLSTWGFKGLNWWEHPWVSPACWAIMAVVWLALVLWRRTTGYPGITAIPESDRK